MRKPALRFNCLVSANELWTQPDSRCLPVDSHIWNCGFPALESGAVGQRAEHGSPAPKSGQARPGREIDARPPTTHADAFKMGLDISAVKARVLTESGIL